MTNLEPMNIEQFQAFVDHAAGKSDRWLFIALLVVVFVLFVIAIRWMAGLNSKSFATYRDDMNGMRLEIKQLHDARLHATEKYADELRSIVRTQNEDARAILREHGEILSRNAEVIGGINSALRELQSSCSLARSSGAWQPYIRPQPQQPPQG